MITKKILQLKQTERKSLLFDYSLFSEEELENKYKLSFKDLKKIYDYSKKRITNIQKENLKEVIKLIKSEDKELIDTISEYRKLLEKSFIV